MDKRRKCRAEVATADYEVELTYCDSDSYRDHWYGLWRKRDRRENLHRRFTEEEQQKIILCFSESVPKPQRLKFDSAHRLWCRDVTVVFTITAEFPFQAQQRIESVHRKCLQVLQEFDLHLSCAASKRSKKISLAPRRFWRWGTRTQMSRGLN